MEKEDKLKDYIYDLTHNRYHFQQHRPLLESVQNYRQSDFWPSEGEPQLQQYVEAQRIYEFP